jgi:hypothetical protein
MALTVSHFDDCSIKDLYESMLYCATQQDNYLDKMMQNPVNNGKDLLTLPNQHLRLSLAHKCGGRSST